MNLSSVLRRLFTLYCLVASAAFILLNAYNVAIDGSSLEHIFRYDVYIVFGECAFLLAVLYSFARMRLKNADLRRILHFPTEQFWLVLLFGVLVSACYHIAEVYLFQIRPFHFLVIRHIMIELALTFTVAVSLYVASSRILRIAAKQMAEQPSLPVDKLRLSSYMGPLTVTYISLGTVSILCLNWFMINSVEKNNTVSIIMLVTISLLVITISTSIFYQLVGTFRRDLTMTMEQIVALPGQERSRLYTKIPLTAPNEMGELVIAFHQMQDYLRRKHEQTEREIELAHQVRNKLLAANSIDHGNVHIEFAGTHGETAMKSGIIYDVHPLQDGTIAVMIGRIPGEALPAALLTASVLMLFRTEARKANNLDNLLNVLNEQIWNILKGDTAVHASFCIIDPHFGSAAVCSNQTLGIKPDLRFKSKAVTLSKADPLVLSSGEYGALSVKIKISEIQKSPKLQPDTAESPIL